jgi:AMMECR1 domain-containing protein
MKNKKKYSPNRITCNISGEQRMSNRQYIAAKAEKAGVDVDTWKDYYVNKTSYKEIVAEVENHGLEKAAENFQVDKKTMVKYLRYNGRGKFVVAKNKFAQPQLIEQAA